MAFNNYGDTQSAQSPNMESDNLQQGDQPVTHT